MKKKNLVNTPAAEQIFSRLSYYLNSKHISVYKLHYLTGISMSTLYGIFRSRKNLPSLTNLLCILDALDVRPDIFFAPQIPPEFEYVADGGHGPNTYK